MVYALDSVFADYLYICLYIRLWCASVMGTDGFIGFYFVGKKRWDIVYRLHFATAP